MVIASFLNTFVIWQRGNWGRKRQKLHFISLKISPLWNLEKACAIVNILLGLLPELWKGLVCEGGQAMVKSPLLMFTFPNNIFLGSKSNVREPLLGKIIYVLFYVSLFRHLSVTLRHLARSSVFLSLLSSLPQILVQSWWLQSPYWALPHLDHSV